MPVLACLAFSTKYGDSVLLVDIYFFTSLLGL